MIRVPVRKADTSIDVDETRFTTGVNAYIYTYGLTQILNDAHSQITEKSYPDAEERAETALALAMKKLDALYSGDVTTRVQGPRDPVYKRAVDIASRKVATKKDSDGYWRASLGTIVRFAETKVAAVLAVAREAVKTNPAYRHMAEMQLEQEAALEADEILVEDAGNETTDAEGNDASADENIDNDVE
jgi:hypothetical protein